jgi:hypothetical protein
MHHPLGHARVQFAVPVHDRLELDRQGTLRLLRVATDQPVGRRDPLASQDPPVRGVDRPNGQPMPPCLARHGCRQPGLSVAVSVSIQVRGRPAERRLERLQLLAKGAQGGLALA